jgi:hypothetical protein
MWSILWNLITHVERYDRTDLFLWSPQPPNITASDFNPGGGHLKDIVYWKSQLSGGTSAFYGSDCVDITTDALNFWARSEFLASQGSVYSLTGGIFGNSWKQFVTIKALVCLSMMTLTYHSVPKIWSHLISCCFSVLLAKRYQHALIETSFLDLGIKRGSFVYCSLCN